MSLLHHYNALHLCKLMRSSFTSRIWISLYYTLNPSLVLSRPFPPTSSHNMQYLVLFPSDLPSYNFPISPPFSHPDHKISDLAPAASEPRSSQFKKGHRVYLQHPQLSEILRPDNHICVPPDPRPPIRNYLVQGRGCRHDTSPGRRVRSLPYHSIWIKDGMGRDA